MTVGGAFDHITLSGLRLPRFRAGEVWLTGAGPGDPGLLTLHAVNALSQADIILYDALVHDAVLRLASPKVALEFAGKRGGRPSPDQRDITERLIELAREGRLTIPTGKIFPLAEAADAVRFLQSRQSTGKLLLIP